MPLQTGLGWLPEWVIQTDMARAWADKHDEIPAYTGKDPNIDAISPLYITEWLLRVLCAQEAYKDRAFLRTLNCTWRRVILAPAYIKTHYSFNELPQSGLQHSLGQVVRVTELRIFTTRQGQEDEVGEILVQYLMNRNYKP